MKRVIGLITCTLLVAACGGSGSQAQAHSSTKANMAALTGVCNQWGTDGDCGSC